MNKAVSILNTIKSFIEFTNAYCNGLTSEIKYNFDEVELFRLLDRTRTNVDIALNDDFNTATALNEILNLISSLNKIYNSKKSKEESAQVIHSNYGGIMACLNYIRFIFNSFGLKLELTSQNQSFDSSNVSDFLFQIIFHQYMISIVLTQGIE